MICKFCRTENSDGREKCAICGNPLLDIHSIIERDRLSRKALRWAVSGIFIGGFAGALIGLIGGFLMAGLTHPVLSAFIGFWNGGWLGAIGGAVVGALLGLATS